MKRITLLMLGFILPVLAGAQSYPHYTMFMFNKLLYNPAYAGSRDVTSINATYRDQWTGIDGAPKSINVSIDGPVGSYMKPFRHVALGFSVNNDALGVTNNTTLMAYYAYRIPIGKTVLSLGIQAGTSIYSADYSRLNPYQTGDQSLNTNVNNNLLPNVGAGVYWTGEHFYLGASVPNLLENYYDKDNKTINNDKSQSQQLRSYFLSGGYVFTLSEALKLEPQVLVRYAGDGNYQLPANADMNLSLIIYDRILIGATYRTDKSVEGIVHLQVTKNLNIGYGYDYTAGSDLNGYAKGTHEITLGFDFVRDYNKYVNPRFIKMF